MAQSWQNINQQIKTRNTTHFNAAVTNNKKINKKEKERERGGRGRERERERERE